MIPIPAAVKPNGADLFRERALGNQFSDLTRPIHFGTGISPPCPAPGRNIPIAGRGKGPAEYVINRLDPDVIIGTKHRESRLLRSAAHASAHATMPHSSLLCIICSAFHT